MDISRREAPVLELTTPSARGARSRTWQQLFALSALSYLGLTLALLGVSWWLNERTLVYSLDDPYIHLAMVRTWLRSQTIGISPGQFAPASSSPLWTAWLLGCVKLVGLRDQVPLVLNLVCSLATLAVFFWGRAQLMQLGREGGHALADQLPHSGFIALALPVLLNLPGLTLCGMEHVLHAALVLAFVVLLLRDLGREQLSAGPFLLAAMLPLVRLESVFVIGAAALLLRRRRRPLPALLLLMAAATPMSAMGLATRAHGAFFLPNSIVAKAVPPELDALLGKWGYTLLGLSVHPLLLLILGFSLRYRHRQRGLVAEGFVLCFIVAALHVLLSTVGGIGLIDRYESYVVDLGLLFILTSAGLAPAQHSQEPPQARWSRGLERALAGLGVLEKGALVLAATLATNDIYEQQYQTARFVQQQLPGRTVAVNDIGLVALRSEGRVLDLAGLGSTDVLRALRQVADTRQLTRAAIQPLIEQHGVDAIAIYTAWFKPELYGSWKHVAAWSLPRPPIVAGDSRVDFFAPDEPRARALEQRLRAFERELPGHVQVQYQHRAPEAQPTRTADRH